MFKIGECHVYPKTKIYDLALSLPDVVFDDDGVFGGNVVRRPSRSLDFDTVGRYVEAIFKRSNPSPKLGETMLKMMPFFRLPIQALKDEMIPDACYEGRGRDVLDVRAENLNAFRGIAPMLGKKYEEWAGRDRTTRTLAL